MKRHPGGSVGRNRVENQTVATDTRVTGARDSREFIDIKSLCLIVGNKEKIVAVGMRLRYREQLRNAEGVEHPSQADGRANLWIG